MASNIGYSDVTLSVELADILAPLAGDPRVDTLLPCRFSEMADSPRHLSGEHSAIAGSAIRMLLHPLSMVVLDIVVIAIIVGSLLVRLFNLRESLTDSISQHQLSVYLEAYGAIADLLVFYGVALESRAHLIRREGLPEATRREDRLDHVSEHTGITLVVWGILLEVIGQVGQLTLDFSIPFVIHPLRIIGLFTMVISILQLTIHLRSSVAEVVRSRRRPE